uniref:Protein kinase n=1 Tax=Pithovirus LCPAC401 TaxID=2506595 RepID=A0A481Z9V7_9VIRU|nr:MAG: protein kinase [Pithovirus LCPAC401]
MIGNLAPLNFTNGEFVRLSIDAYHNRGRIQNNIIEQRKLEEELLRIYNPCSDIKEDMSSSMSKFKSNEFERLLTYDFYNVNVMKAAQCINKAYFSHNAYPYEVKIRKWFTSMKQIGSPSAYGTAIQTNISKKQSVYVIKAPKDIEVDLLHEYIIGIYGLNKLRYTIPNFAYILGAFKCNPPYIQKDKKIDAVCLPDSKNKVTYVVYERIYPGVELSEYILSCSESEFMSVWLQLCYSLDLAQRDMKYNHNDLHTENVIVRTMSEEVFIPYRYKGIVVYIRTRTVATLIDYGLSRIDLNHRDKVYTVTDASMYSYKPFRFNSLRDIFKLLSFCVYSLIGKRAPSSRLIFALYRFFYNGDRLEGYIHEMRKNYFSYYEHENNRGVTLSTYIDWIHKNFKYDIDNVISWNYRDISLKLLACDNRCATKKGIISFLDAFGEGKAEDLIDLYDHVSKLSTFKSQTEYMRVNRTLFINEVNKAINILTRVLEHSKKSIFMRWNLAVQETYTHKIDFMFNINFINKYRSHIDEFMSMIDEFSTSKNYLDISLMLLRYISDGTKKNVDKLSAILKETTSVVNELIRKIKVDIDFVRRIPSNRFTVNEASKWWILSFTQLSNILP